MEDHDVKTKEDFVKYLRYLIKDFKNNKEGWENINLEHYLVSMANWVEDVDEDMVLMENQTFWRAMANVVTAAKVYE